MPAAALGGAIRCTPHPAERDAMSMEDSVGAQDSDTNTEQLRTDIEQTAPISARMSRR